jgi:hypothetical protein
LLPQVTRRSLIVPYALMMTTEKLSEGCLKAVTWSVSTVAEQTTLRALERLNLTKGSEPRYPHTPA